MKHSIGIYILASLFTAFFFIWLTDIPGMAKTAGEVEKVVQSIGDASKGILNLEEKRADVNERLSKIKSAKKDVLVYIEKLDKELGILNEDIEALSGDIEKESAEYEILVKELKKADLEKRNQYETMKSRIKYMYENGNQEYLELILSSGSLSELMNRTEYISKITQYDNELFDTYCQLEEDVLIKREKAEEKLKELNALKDTKEFERNSLKLLSRDKNKELEAYNEQIGKTKEELKKYNEEILRQEKLLEQLLEEERIKVAREQKRLEEERKKNAKEDGEEDAEEDNEEEGEHLSLFSWPLGERGTITGNFGYREVPIAGASSFHNGLDIGVPQGTPILAAASGTVVVSRYSSTAGNFIMIYHGGTTYSVYMHASELVAEEGEIVYQGQVIAFVGSTGLSTGPHLHFGINVGNEYADPLEYVEQP